MLIKKVFEVSFKQLLYHKNFFFFALKKKNVFACLHFCVFDFQLCFFGAVFFRRLLGCSTGVCSTIQIEQVMFDDPQKLGCSTRIMFDVEQQLSNKTLIEHNFCPRLCSINVYFD